MKTIARYIAAYFCAAIGVTAGMAAIGFFVSTRPPSEVVQLSAFFGIGVATAVGGTALAVKLILETL